MIRLFISSTFKNLHEERNRIHSKIYPELREYGLKKGVNVDICDLRWGLKVDDYPDEGDRLAAIMKSCFKEIDNCKPYIISIIDDYYGTEAKQPEGIIRVIDN